MLRLLKRLFIYLLLLIGGRRRHEKFIKKVVKNCKRRRHCGRVSEIAEELDEALNLPEDFVDSTNFVGFTKDGHIAVFKTVKWKSILEYASVSLEMPGIGKLKYTHSRPLDFGRGKLTLHMEEAMRRWKIQFHGTVQSQTDDTNRDPLHVSISLNWQCLSDPFDHTKSLNRWQLASNISLRPLNSLFRETSLCAERIWYEQWGEMWGKVEIEGHGAQYMRFKSFRTHKIERIGGTIGETLISHHLLQENGEVYATNGCVQGENETVGLRFGFLTTPVGEHWLTDQSDLDLDGETSSQLSIRYPLKIKANSRSLTLNRILRNVVPLRCKSLSSECFLSFASYTINGERAYGINLVEAPLRIPPVELNPSNTIKAYSCLPQLNRLAIQIQEAGCGRDDVVGGKGAKLHLLHDLQFTVPRGFCLTTLALKLQHDYDSNLRQAVDRIQATIQNKSLAELRGCCADAVQICIGTKLCPAVRTAVEEALIRTFGFNYSATSYAIRSSGVGEDGVDSSMAGQLETFLCIRGEENILEAIRKCWSSSFAYRAVEYRRQNGQPVLEPMAVVVQEMVDADVAGVLFTNDPMSGNTRTMVINATPGLGETVVSGQCNPDTVVVRRGKDPTDFHVVERKVGEKRTRLTAALESGVLEVQTAAEEQTLSLQEDEILELCKVGFQLEHFIGCAQDIEWAIFNGRLFLLQTRNITSLNDDTDEQLLHEFDTPIAMESECIVRSNIGDVLPDAITPLSQHLIIPSASYAASQWVAALTGLRFPVYADTAALSCTNTAFFNITAMSASEDGVFVTKQSLEIALTGQVLNEHPMRTIQAFRGGRRSWFTSWCAFVNAIVHELPRSVNCFSNYEKSVASFTLGEHKTSALELYIAIDQNLYHYFEIKRAYQFKIVAATLPFSILSSILRGSMKESDIAILLSSCSNVISSELPNAIRQLAKAISKSDVEKEFLQLPDEKGHHCLMNGNRSVRTIYQKFINDYGHRCLKECDFTEKSWRSEPKSLMRALKVLVKSPSKLAPPEKERLTNEEMVKMIKTPLSWFQRFFIRTILLDKVKAGVASRESAKSVFVKCVDVFKRAYWKLADLMVREGRLPEEKLLFFLTHSEIGSLLDKRSAVLVRKARRRMHVFVQQSSIKYPQVNFGRPTPLSEHLKDKEQISSGSSMCLTGTPVGQGTVTGKVRVATTLKDADSIESGEILICPFTDIGWSPYFPMISGLVTEMGGLISHGAVIAREVGLPCIVNVTDATRLFKTGDRVKLDGLGGVVQRLDD